MQIDRSSLLLALIKHSLSALVYPRSGTGIWFYEDGGRVVAIWDDGLEDKAWAKEKFDEKRLHWVEIPVGCMLIFEMKAFHAGAGWPSTKLEDNIRLYFYMERVGNKHKHRPKLTHNATFRFCSELAARGHELQAAREKISYQYKPSDM